MVIFKAAFSMLELIFAIVMIGISVLALPMVNQVTTEGIVHSIDAQEGLYKAIVMTKYETMKNHTYTTLDTAKVTTATPIQTGSSASDGLQGYKYDHSYTMDVTNSSFGGTTTGVKKVTTNIYNEESELVVQLIAYKFDR